MISRRSLLQVLTGSLAAVCVPFAAAKSAVIKPTPTPSDEEANLLEKLAWECAGELGLDVRGTSVVRDAWKHNYFHIRVYLQSGELLIHNCVRFGLADKTGGYYADCIKREWKIKQEIMKDLSMQEAETARPRLASYSDRIKSVSNQEVSVSN